MLLLLAVPFLSLPSTAREYPSGSNVYVPFGKTTTFQAPFNLGYIGDDTLLLRCYDRQDYPNNIPVCRNNTATGDSVTYIRLWNQPQDPLAYAGVGLQYELIAQCSGQQVGRPMYVTYQYSRSSNATVSPSTSGQADTEIWANALYGRDDAPLGSSGGNQRQEWWTQVNGTAARSRATVTKTVSDTPSSFNVPYQSLLYSRSHAVAAGVLEDSYSIKADVHMTLDKMTFSWRDTTAPNFLSQSYATTYSGGYHVGYDGSRIWFHFEGRVLVDWDDDISCPKQVHYTLNPGAPEQTGWPGYAKDPVTISIPGEGRYDIQHFAVDHEGNRAANRTVKVGMDNGMPIGDVVTVPELPDGANGWFKTRPDLSFICLDDVSGCYKTEYYVDSSGWRTSYSNVTRWGVLGDGKHVAKCYSYDNARWVNGSACYEKINVDSTGPTLTAHCTKTAGGAEAPCLNGWHNASLSVRLACADPWSGCTTDPLTYSLDGGPATPYSAPFLVEGQAYHSLTLSGWDNASNGANRTYNLSIDLTPPDKPAVNETHNRRATNQNPAWRWSGADDFSGVQEWILSVNNGTPFTKAATTTSLTHSVSADGTYCLVVKAKDRAGNVGPASDPSCILVDRTLPTIAIHKPVKGTIYLNDGVLRTTTTTIPHAIALRRLSLESTAADGGTAPSGLVLHKSLLASNGGSARDWQPANQPSNACALDGAVCNQTYAPPSWLSGTGLHTWTVRAQDEAGNIASASIAFDFVNLLAVGGVTASGLPAADLEWVPYGGEGQFIRYELHRSLVSGFTPSAATKLKEFPDVGATGHQDTDVLAQTTYYYQVVYVSKPLDSGDGSVSALSGETTETSQEAGTTTGGGGSDGDSLLERDRPKAY